jgi:hypothetical protein
MATKKELLKTLTEAGVKGYSTSDSHADLEKAVAVLVPPVNRQKGI